MESLFIPAFMLGVIGEIVMTISTIARLVSADLPVPFTVLFIRVVLHFVGVLLIAAPLLTGSMTLAARWRKREVAGDGYLRAVGTFSIYVVLVVILAIGCIGVAIGSGAEVLALLMFPLMIGLWLAVVRYAFRVGYATSLIGSSIFLVGFFVVSLVLLLVGMAITSVSASRLVGSFGDFAGRTGFVSPDSNGTPKTSTARAPSPTASVESNPSVVTAPPVAPVVQDGNVEAEFIAKAEAVLALEATIENYQTIEAQRTELLAWMQQPTNLPLMLRETPKLKAVYARLRAQSNSVETIKRIVTMQERISAAKVELGVDPETDGATAWADLRAEVEALAAFERIPGTRAAISEDTARLHATADKLTRAFGRDNENAIVVEALLTEIDDDLRKLDPTAPPTTSSEEPPAPQQAETTGGSESPKATIDELLATIRNPPVADAVNIANSALEQLANTPRDGSKREEVADLLESILFERNSPFAEKAANALEKWWGPRTCIRVLALLDPDVEEARVFLGMRVLAATKDPRAVWPVARWLLKYPDRTVNTLIAFGPVAEADMLRLLVNKDPKARMTAAKVLAEVGGSKSLQPLARASNDRRDADAAAVAQRAYVTVKDRTQR